MCSLMELLFLLGISMTLASCMVGPDFHSPAPPKTHTYTTGYLPAKTVSTAGAGEAGKAQQFVMGKDIPAEWWAIFHSPALDSLVRAGIANSPNLAAAQATLRQAQETFRAQVGVLLYPAVSAQISAQRGRFSDVSVGVDRSSIFNIYNPVLNVSYALDVFGGSRRELEALCAQVNYQYFQLEGAYLTLTSNIVTTAIVSASLRAQIAATHDLIQSQEDQLHIVRQQFQLGGVSRADVLSQENQVAQTRATLPPLEQSLAQSQHTLAVLVGVLPSEAHLPRFNLDHLTLPAELPVKLPSALVQQRPDIRASEALLHAASAQVGVATANLFPQLTLTGTYGWIGNSPGDLFSFKDAVWNYGVNILQPIYNGGSLQAQRRAAIAAFEQAKAQYQETVLQAFRNVADSLRALENDAKTLCAQKAAEVAAKDSLVLTQKQFQLGGVSYLSLLTAQRNYQQARISRIQAQASRYTDTAALFQALGGGWTCPALVAENGCDQRVKKVAA